MKEDWRDYTDRYTNIDKADLIHKMRKAIKETLFCGPPRHVVSSMTSTIDDILNLIENYDD